MKNNKHSPLTIARQTAFRHETGIQDFSRTSLLPLLAPLNDLCAELIGVDTEEQKQARIAMESTTQGYRENSPELYGRNQMPAAMFINGLPVLHKIGTSADCELDETSQALVSTVFNAGLQDTSANDTENAMAGE